jgi:glucokinase
LPATSPCTGWRGGVYLAGGLAAKLLPHVDTQPFIAAFLAKREHRELVATMPVHALTSEDLGLLGTLAHAASL